MRRLLSIIATLFWLAGNAGVVHASAPVSASLLSIIEAGLQANCTQKADVSDMRTSAHEFQGTGKHTRPDHDTSNHTHDAGTGVMLAPADSKAAEPVWPRSLVARLAKALLGSWDRPPRDILY